MDDKSGYDEEEDTEPAHVKWDEDVGQGWRKLITKFMAMHVGMNDLWFSDRSRLVL